MRNFSDRVWGEFGDPYHQLLIAAAKAAHRPWMVPSGQEPPKNDDAKTKIDQVLRVLGTSSLVGRLSKLVDAAWNLAVGTLHNDNAEGPATYALAQATILIVRELALVEPYIQAREAAATD